MKKLLVILIAGLPLAAFGEATASRLNSAATVLSEIMATPDQGIPMELMARAECVAVIPGVKQGAFGFGAKYGKGFFSCRKAGGWSAPAAIRIEGGTVGFQIGATESDLVLLVLNHKGAQRLLSTRFTVGGAGEAAIGPLGRQSTAQTDISLRAEMLSWSRSRGVFAGVSLQGATLRQDISDNIEMYGSWLSNKQIINGKVEWPRGGGELHSVLDRYSSAAGRK